MPRRPLRPRLLPRLPRFLRSLPSVRLSPPSPGFRALRPSVLRSLRWRLAGLVAAVTCAAVAVVVTSAHSASHAYEFDRIRSSADTTLDRAASAYRRTGSVTHTGAELDTPVLPPALRTRAWRGEAGTQYADGPGGPAMWAVRPAGEGHTLSVRIPMATTLGDLRGFDRRMLMAGLLTLAVVLPLGALTAGRMSRRLRMAAATARRIADGDLDARISAKPHPYDEIAGISGAVDSMAASLQGRLRSEQRFTADVAHELRTPLMGLVTAAELLPEGKVEGFVQDRVQALRVLIEDLLEISRLDAGVEKADLSYCALVPMVTKAVERTDTEATVRVAEGPRDGVREPGPGGPPVHGPGAGLASGPLARERGEVRGWTDPRRFERIVSNLLVNAHRHGGTPVTVTVAADGREVAVADRGPGFPAHVLESGPERFRTGSRVRGKGHGLGLTIALGQAEVIGAALEFANSAEGARVTVRLPRGPEPAPTPG